MAYDPMRQAFIGDIARSRRIGQGLEDQYVSGMSGFDPYAAYREAAQGAFGDFRRQFAENLQSLRGQQVGMGRFDSSLATRDEDRLFTEMGSRLADTISQGALQAGQMRLQQLGQMGDYAARLRDTATQAAFGDWATRHQQQAADRASRRSMWGHIAGGVASAMGPIGAAALPLIFASDERLKTNVSPIEDALGAIREIPGVGWNWNQFGAALTGQTSPDAGVLAQDVARAFPQAAAVDPMTGVMGVNYGTEDTSMVGLLTEAIRELDAKVGMLEAALLGQAPQMVPEAPMASMDSDPYGMGDQGSWGDPGGMGGLDMALMGQRPGMMG